LERLGQFADADSFRREKLRGKAVFSEFPRRGSGQGKLTKSHPEAEARLPPPVLTIKLVAGRCLKQEFVIGRWTGSDEGLFPALTGALLASNHQVVSFDAQLGRFFESVLFKDDSGNANATRITDTHEFNPHDCLLLVIIM
jgi:hypothetical protein